MRINLNDNELEIFCEHINSIIEEAIEHGGDRGGAYFSNQEALEHSIILFLNWVGLNKYVTLYKDSIPKLIIKEKIYYEIGENNEKG